MRRAWVLILLGACSATSADDTGDDDAPRSATYIKASNTGIDDKFGTAIDVSGNGATLVVGAWAERSNATGIDGDQSNNEARFAGAAYVFTRAGDAWAQQAYLKASNTNAEDAFGYAVAISGDGSTIAIGATGEASAGDPVDNSAPTSGAVYVFVRAGETWTEEAYLKAPVPRTGAGFGHAVALTEDGSRLVIGASNDEDVGAAYIFARAGGVWTQEDVVHGQDSQPGDAFGYSVAISAPGDLIAVGADFETFTGAVYVFRRAETWQREAILTADDAMQDDAFGYSVALSADGTTVAVGAVARGVPHAGSGAVFVYAHHDQQWTQEASFPPPQNTSGQWFGASISLTADGSTLLASAPGEASGATGIDGDSNDRSAPDAGAAYLFSRTDGAWTRTRYLKATNTEAGDSLGISEISADGKTIALAAPTESGAAIGIDGDQTSNTASRSGACYVYVE